MSDAFIEDRRGALEKYLRKLAAHPVVGLSEVRSTLQARRGSRKALVLLTVHIIALRLRSCHAVDVEGLSVLLM
jgi:hypothetical protein